ncbi:MAG: hypothetical protein AAGI53_07120 [Planctomycetota bacterium]
MKTACIASIVIASTAMAQTSGIPFEVIVQSNTPAPGGLQFDSFGIDDATVGSNRAVAFSARTSSSDFSTTLIRPFTRQAGGALSEITLPLPVPFALFPTILTPRIDDDGRVHVFAQVTDTFENFFAATDTTGTGTASVVFRETDPIPTTGEVPFSLFFGTRPDSLGRYAVSAQAFTNVPPFQLDAAWYATPSGVESLLLSGDEIVPGSGVTIVNPRASVSSLDRTANGYISRGGFGIPGEPSGDPNESGFALVLDGVPLLDSPNFDEGDTLPGFGGRTFRVDFIDASFFNNAGAFAVSPRNALVSATVSVVGDPDAEFLGGFVLVDDQFGARVIAVGDLPIQGTTFTDDVLIQRAQLSDDGRRVFIRGFDLKTDDVVLLYADVDGVEFPDFEALTESDFVTLDPNSFFGGMTDDGRAYIAFNQIDPDVGIIRDTIVCEDGYGNLRQVVSWGDRPAIPGFYSEGNEFVGSIELPGDERVTNRCGSILVKLAGGFSSNGRNTAMLRYDLPHPDRDCSGDLTSQDVLLFLSLAESGSLEADANGDGEVNFFDTLLQIGVVEAAN